MRPFNVSPMHPYLDITRPFNCIMAGVGVFIGALAGSGWDVFDRDVLPFVILAYGAAAFATAAGNIMNDMVDSETDRVNHPGRPLPSGRMRREEASRMVFLFYGMTLILGSLINLLNFLIVVVNVSLMVGYELSLKRKGFIGNLAISWLTGSTFLFGGAAAVGRDSYMASFMDAVNSEAVAVTAVLALLAFLASLGREVIKDIEDMEGDADRVTLPRRVGAKRAGRLAAAFILLAVGMSFLPWWPLEIFSMAYMVGVLPADGMFFYSVMLIRRDPHGSQRSAKIAMFIALLAFLAGGLAG